MRRDVAALVKTTKETLFLKLKMMLCIDDVAAGRRRLHIKAVYKVDCVKYRLRRG